MTGVLRTWHCHNSRCGHEFDSWEPNPHCPACKCVRTGWVPGGGHVGGASKGAERELRILADMFKMTDMNSAQAGQAAKKVNVPAPTNGRVHNFGGFAAAVDPAAHLDNGYNGAQCVPVANKVNYKIKAAREAPLPPNKVFGKPTPALEYIDRRKAT